MAEHCTGCKWQAATGLNRHGNAGLNENTWPENMAVKEVTPGLTPDPKDTRCVLSEGLSVSKHPSDACPPMPQDHEGLAATNFWSPLDDIPVH